MARLIPDNGEITIPSPHIIIIQIPRRFGLKVVVDNRLPITEIVIMGCTPKIETKIEMMMKMLPVRGVNSDSPSDISLPAMRTVRPVDITPAARNKLNSRFILGKSTPM